jgi:integrase/recombinase XerC
VELDADAAPIAVHILGKGESQRERRTIPSASVTAMSAWLARRGSAPGSLIGLSNRGVAKVLDRLAAKAKLGRVRVHGLRHTSITVALVQNNGNIAKTMDHSRHVSPVTVMKYNDNRLNSAGEMATAVSSAL